MINKKNIYKLLVLFFFCNIFIISAQENWEIKKKEDGIEIYTSESAVKFNSFRGHIILDNSINSFVAFLKDMDEYVH